jgi:glycosyltransferase involved in cell wall biosynthesis
VELVLADARDHAEALALSASCDLAVDQLLVGAYGQYAVEMMALGKPTICYLREDVQARYPPGCPVIPACPDDFEQVLADWAAHPQRWAQIARRGRRYVRQVHDKRVVARQCLRAYRRDWGH